MNAGVTPTPTPDKPIFSHKHMMFEEGKRFAEMFDMEKTPYLEGEASSFHYFEPAPRDKHDDSTLEGCLYHAAKVESLVDKQNLYLCEPCTEDRYGKSKNLYL